jgi:hypothetical protein
MASELDERRSRAGYITGPIKMILPTCSHGARRRANSRERYHCQPAERGDARAPPRQVLLDVPIPDYDFDSLWRS